MLPSQNKCKLVLIRYGYILSSQLTKMCKHLMTHRTLKCNCLHKCLAFLSKCSIIHRKENFRSIHLNLSLHKQEQGQDFLLCKRDSIPKSNIGLDLNSFLNPRKLSSRDQSENKLHQSADRQHNRSQLSSLLFPSQSNQSHYHRQLHYSICNCYQQSRFLNLYNRINHCRSQRLETQMQVIWQGNIVRSFMSSKNCFEL